MFSRVFIVVPPLFQNAKQRSEDNHCHAMPAQHARRRNSPFGVTASVFVHGSTCITIAISINIMHIAIFNVGKQKRHFSTSKLTKSLSCSHKHKTNVSTSNLTKSLSCNHKHKTYVRISNVINSLSYTPQGYCMAVALQVQQIRRV